MLDPFLHNMWFHQGLALMHTFFFCKWVLKMIYNVQFDHSLILMHTFSFSKRVKLTIMSTSRKFKSTPFLSKVGVSKLELLLSQNFGRSYLFQIKLSLEMWMQYLITLKMIFSTMYSTPQLEFIWPLLSKGLWLGVKFPIWLPPLFLIITNSN